MIAATSLHRTAKLEIDEGLATTIEEAYERASRWKLQVDVGVGIEASPTRQAMLLTILNVAPRCFLGGVRIKAAHDMQLTIPWAAGKRLSDIAQHFGCASDENLSADLPTISISGGAAPSLTLYPTWNGWSGGVATDLADRLSEAREFPLAGVLAGAIATSEAFQMLRGEPTACRRTIGLSLWRPEIPWRDPEAAGAICPYLPSRLWILGLGHLGQAYAWALAMLPYNDLTEVLVALQDFDMVEEANLSTGLLTTPDDLGRLKTRLVADRLEELGVRTRIIERRFDENFRRSGREPGLALSGFDRREPRRALSPAGFQLAVDGGIGAGPSQYTEMMIHAFPSMTPSRTAFGREPRPRTVPVDQPAYESEVSKAVDAGMSEDDARCGILEVAGQSVAAAFVGAATACLVLAEPLRMLSNGPRYEVVDWSLRSGGVAEVIPNDAPGPAINPGYVNAATWGRH